MIESLAAKARLREGDKADVETAFRSHHKSKLDTDMKLFKKLDMQAFIEDMRSEENAATFNFLEQLDPLAEAKNIKMLYLYREGAEAQYKGLA